MKRNTRQYTALLGLSTLCVAVPLITQAQDAPVEDAQAQRTRRHSSKEIASILPALTTPRFILGVKDFVSKIEMPKMEEEPSGSASTGDKKDKKKKDKKKDDQEVQLPVASEISGGLATLFTAALTNSERFLVLAADSGVTRRQPSYVLRGVLTDCSATSKTTGLFGFRHTEVKVNLALEIQVCGEDGETVLKSISARGDTTSSSNGLALLNGKLSFKSVNQGALGDAARKAIQKAVGDLYLYLREQAWEAKVADVEADGSGVKTLYLNAGQQAGLKVGDMFDLIAPGRVIQGQGRAEGKRVGACKIVALSPTIATAEITEGGEDVAAGHIARYQFATARP